MSNEEKEKLRKLGMKYFEAFFDRADWGYGFSKASLWHLWKLYAERFAQEYANESDRQQFTRNVKL